MSQPQGHVSARTVISRLPLTQVNLLDGLQHMQIPSGQTYKSPGTAYVEGDASSASYFLAGATITGGESALVSSLSQPWQVVCRAYSTLSQPPVPLD